MKRNVDYVIDSIDKAINELVFDKWKLQKAYNYYNGKRDAELFRYLEENFGIGNPTSMEFTPLIKKHIDAITGEYLDIPLLPKISCKDKSTISKIDRDLQIKISKEVYSYYKKYLNNKALSFVLGENPTEDLNILYSITKLIEDVKNDFISDYEVAALNVIEYCIQSRTTDLHNKLRCLLLDLLITGCAFYRVKPSSEKTNIVIEVLNPLNTFIDRNPESQYVKDSYRSVVRKWMTKLLILNEYGSEMDKDSLAELDDMHDNYDGSSEVYVRSMTNVAMPRPYGGEMAGLDSAKGIVPGFPSDTYESFNYKLLPVYEVEWVDVDKEGEEYVQNRYEGIKIGASIYIPRGKSKNIIRSTDAPTKCGLSVGGIFLVNRDMVPLSLVLQCAALLDKYDVVMYLRDNVLANSGTAGDWVDLSMLPSVLGSDLTERLQKFLAYKKAGAALIDTSQEGRAFNNNTTIAGFDDTLKLQTIQAFDLVLLRIEELTSSITGVFRERLNGIQQRDAVSNVEAGARNSYIITKPFYQQMDTLTMDILRDCLDMGKIVWKKGLTGTIILGDKLSKVFTALPEHFTISDHDVHIVPSTLILKDMLQLLGIVIEMIKGNLMEPDMAVDAITARSLTELKDKVSKAWARKKAENNLIQLMQLLIQQYELLLLELQKQNKLLQSKLESVDLTRIEFEKLKLLADSEIRWYMAKTDRDYKTSQSEIDQRKVQAEIALMYDGNPYNNQVRMD